MMKKLIYLFMGLLALAGCHDPSSHSLRKAKALWEANNFDSLHHYLSQIDSSALSRDGRHDYYLLRMHNFAYMKALGATKADSITRALVKHYQPKHPWAFIARLLQIVSVNHLSQDFPKGDSLITASRAFLRNRNDSSTWYVYKYSHKARMGERDSAIHYLKEALHLRLMSESYAYNNLGAQYEASGKGDSAVEAYFRALQADTTQSVFFYAGKVLNYLQGMKDTQRAREYLQGLRKQMRRKDIPYIQLVEGDLWMQMHQPDSALKHYTIASESGNEHIAQIAFERMGDLLAETHASEKAMGMYRQALNIKGSSATEIHRQLNEQNFEALRMKNELNELKVERQGYVILILGLGAFILLLCGSFAIYLLHRKRKHLMQENLMLKQQEELSLLREKEALLREKDAKMREELFRRIRIVKDLEEGNRVHIAEDDWKDIHVMLESTYPGFLQKLRNGFPDLPEKDINFCCLVKINMSLQNLADIYCISVNSVSRRKLRLKEKLGIDKEDSLSKFLNRFV